MRRLGPVLGLFFLAPFIAEYLLGDLPLQLLPAMVVLAPFYGGGALLVREIVRRKHRGWVSLLVLALAFGIFEEAFTTQTLFNPNYLGMNLNLLQPAYIAAWGIGGWWTVFVLTLHTVWSISTPVLLAEALWPERASEPWLGKVGIVVAGLLFALGAVAFTLMSYKRDHFVASKTQFLVSALACVLTIVMALRVPKPSAAREPGPVPAAWMVGLGSLIVCSAFKVVPNRWGWGAVGVYFLLFLVAAAAVSVCSRRSDWGAPHRLALAAGATLAYAWHSFLEPPLVGGKGPSPFVSHVVFALTAVALLGLAVARISPVRRPLAVSSH